MMILGKNVLLINDLPGYGKVALAAMVPVLSHIGCRVYTLPTALVSNTLDYGKFDILETTDYMERTIRVWDELGFSFDAVSVGFIVSARQAALAAEYCAERRKKGAVIFVDPIMGDDGKLYNGITEKTVSNMRRLIAISDYAVPNWTEAAFMAGREFRPEGMTKAEALALVDSLRELGARSMTITSAKVEGRDCVIAHDAESGATEFLPFDFIPVRFPGTGDIYSSVFIGRVLNGGTIAGAAQSAMTTVRSMIERYASEADKYRGIPIEDCLDLLER